MGSSEKGTSDYKLVRCLTKRPWHTVSDNWVPFLLTCFKWLQSLFCKTKITSVYEGSNGFTQQRREKDMRVLIGHMLVWKPLVCC